MGNKDFKKFFDEIAKTFGFESMYGGWFKDSKQCILAVELMRSNFGNYYKINIKLYVQGVFGNTYLRSKELVKKFTGNCFRGEPKEYEDALDLENQMDDAERKAKLISFFKEFLVPFSEKALTRTGVIELAQEKQIVLPPAVRNEIDALN